MACPQVVTGSEFLVRTLAHLDCQAQTIGSFGFQSLAASGSLAGIVLSALLALFIALYAIRLLFGPGDEPRDLVNAVLKVGIVLTMAVSWPAWRTLAYDTVLYGPAEVASAIMPSTLPDPRDGFAQRLQRIDTGMARLTATGTGRETGQPIDTSPESSFSSVALTDETALGWARTAFLSSTIGALAALRISGGLLLALAPLIAGLLLFDLTRGIFAGWLRGLALVALGSVAMTVLLSVEAALVEPWLVDALNRRTLGYSTPAAPTELLALTAAFGLATAGMLVLLGKVTFQQVMGSARPALARIAAGRSGLVPSLRQQPGPARIPVHSRALAVSEGVEAVIRRETTRESIDRARLIGGLAMPTGTQATPGRAAAGAEPLGSGYRRTSRRDARSHRARDERP